MALVSAHRGGSGDARTAQNTVAAFEAAIAVGCDYVEFDVRLTADGTPVIFHDDGLEAGETLRSIARHRLDELADVAPLTLDRVLDVVAGRIKAHVDLKVRSDDLRLTQQVVARLGAENVVITTAEDSSVRRIRRWSQVHAPGLLVGLSSSPRSWDGIAWKRRLVRLEAAFPRTRVRLSRANLVVSHKTVARLTLRSYARRRGLPLLVWTVDRPAELARWMNDPDVWMVTTNYPERAVAAVA
jgi:glycerophosphoryl diester phosphodiesterase